MICPDCGCDNLPGMDSCEECGMDLRSLDVPQPRQGLQRSLLEDPLRNLQPRKPLTLGPDDALSAAVRLMKEANEGSVFIVDKDRLVGILTERDLLQKVAGKPIALERTPVRNMMTRDPVVLRGDDSIAYALNRMSMGRYRHVPIVENRRLTGFVSVRGILRYIAEKLR
jgi:CBS domain-containing protein